MLFISKQNNLIIPLLNGLLKFWPWANLQKELAFLTTLNELLDYLEPADDLLLLRLYKRIASCLASSHMRVVDTTMCFF